MSRGGTQVFFFPRHVGRHAEVHQTTQGKEATHVPSDTQVHFYGRGANFRLMFEQKSLLEPSAMLSFPLGPDAHLKLLCMGHMIRTCTQVREVWCRETILKLIQWGANHDQGSSDAKRKRQRCAAKHRKGEASE